MSSELDSKDFILGQVQLSSGMQSFLCHDGLKALLAGTQILTGLQTRNCAMNALKILGRDGAFNYRKVPKHVQEHQEAV